MLFDTLRFFKISACSAVWTKSSSSLSVLCLPPVAQRQEFDGSIIEGPCKEGIGDDVPSTKRLFLAEVWDNVLRDILLVGGVLWWAGWDNVRQDFRKWRIRWRNLLWGEEEMVSKIHFLNTGISWYLRYSMVLHTFSWNWQLEYRMQVSFSGIAGEDFQGHFKAE